MKRLLIIPLLLVAAAAPVPTELDRSVTNLTHACDAENVFACATLAQLGRARPSVGIGYSKQVALFAEACKAGDQDSCADWGRLLSSGPPIDRDWDRIGKLWSDACEHRDEEACALLAQAYARRLVEPTEGSPALIHARLLGAFDALMFDVPRARALARPFLGDHEHSEHARLILACADVTEEHWEQAKEKVRDRLSLDPAYALLNELIRERQAHPDDLWPKSYARAWAKAGQPDMRRSWLYSARSTLRAPVGDETASPLGHLLADYERWSPWISGAWLPPEPLPAEVVQRALDLPDVAEPERLLALRILTAPLIPEALRTKAHDKALAIVDALAQESSEDSAAAFRAFVGESSSTGSFTAAELETIDRLSQIPDYLSPVSETFDSFQAEWIALDPQDGMARAFDAAIDVSAPAWVSVLLQRAEATRGQIGDPQWKQLVASLHRVGERMRDAGSIRERTFGETLMSFDGPSHATAPSEHWTETSPDALMAFPLAMLREDTWNWKSEGETTFDEVLDKELEPPK